jgi:hypothetical protein
MSQLWNKTQGSEAPLVKSIAPNSIRVALANRSLAEPLTISQLRVQTQDTRAVPIEREERSPFSSLSSDHDHEEGTLLSPLTQNGLRSEKIAFNEDALDNRLEVAREREDFRRQTEQKEKEIERERQLLGDKSKSPEMGSPVYVHRLEAPVRRSVRSKKTPRGRNK